MDIVPIKPLLADTQRVYEGPDLEDWYRTPKITTWNTDIYKCYIFDGLAIRLLYPKNFSQDSMKNIHYPAILYFHGYGDRGDPEDNEGQLKVEGKFFKDLVEKGDFNGFILMPQNADGYWTPYDLQRVHRLLDFMVRFKRLDPMQIFFKGYSAGGGGIWRFMKEYPNQVSSAMFIGHPGGEGEYDPKNILEIPLWLCQGLKDQQNTPKSAHWFLDYLKSLGVSLHYTEYPNAGHDLSKETESDPFFLRFLKNSNKLNPNIVYATPGGGQKKFPVLYINEGFPEYEWSINGISIKNSNHYYLKINSPGNYKVRIKMDGEWTYWTPGKFVFNREGQLVE